MRCDIWHLHSVNVIVSAEQNGSAWKTQIRKDINFCIKSASTYEEFLLLMRAKGYEIKGELLKKELPNASHSALWTKSVLCVAVRNLLARNTQKNVSGNALKENGNERQLSPKKTTLPADLLTPLTRNFRTVRDYKGGLPFRI